MINASAFLKKIKQNEVNTDIETRFATDAMNAVPTPRFEVGEVLRAAQPLKGKHNVNAPQNHINENNRATSQCPQLKQQIRT